MSATLIYCPTCGQPTPPRGRVCGRCGQLIKKRHRWHIEGSTVVHDDCELPDKGKVRER
jgi:hypothetical protein